MPFYHVQPLQPGLRPGPYQRRQRVQLEAVGPCHGWNYTGQNTQSRVEFYENSHGVKMDYYPTTGEYHGPW